MAVGLGRLTLQSGLGQALSAEIELTSLQPGEMDTLTARLADQATYASNKIDYGGVLSRIRVALDPRGGKPVLKVTSTQPINEPFLDLLIELNWASGRMLREYTFLLDPPGFAATTAVQPTPAIPSQILAPAAPAAPRPAPPAAAPAPAAPPVAQGGSYGPVKHGETLGKIAAQVKPEGVTLEQMLAALFRANAQAFDGKNMNRLRTGQVLTVPAAAEVSAVSQADALKEIRVQAADWRAYRDRLAGAAPTSEGGAAGQAASGRITTAVDDKGGAGRSASDRLRLSKGEGAAGAGGAAARAENAAASQKALAEANSRVVDLEKQVNDLQRLLELKNSALQAQQAAADQAKLAATSTAAAVAPAAAPAPAPAAAPAPAQTLPVTPPAPVEAPKAEAPKAPAAPAAEPPKAEAPKAEPPKAESEPPKPKPPLRPPAPQPEPSFLDELLSNTWVLIAGAAVIVLGFVGYLMARRRRQVATKFEDSIGAATDIRTSTVFGNTGGGVVNTGDNSLVSDFSREGLGNIDTGEVDPIAEAEVYLAYGRDNQAEEILKDALGKTPDRQEIRLKLLEIYAQQNKPSAFEAVASEVFAATKGEGEIWSKAAQLGHGIDPANPLYAQRGATAEALHELASSAAPVDDDRAPNSIQRAGAAFEKAARELTEQVPKTEVLVMPPDLAPPEPQAAPAPAAHAPATAMPAITPPAPATVMPAPAATPTVLSPPLAAAAAASVAAAAASRASAVHERAPLDFKLDSGPDLAPPPASTGMDFVTLDGPITLTGATTLSGPSTLSGVTLASPSADIWGERVQAKVDETLAKTAPPPDKLPEIKPSEGSPAVAAAVAAGTVSAAGFAPLATSTMTRAPQPTGKLDLDKLDLSFDPSRKVFEDPTPSVLDGQWHDAATKLDLAKAYQEMGDIEGAREILQEVVQEGDEQQKKEAQNFLAKLRA